MTNYIPSHIYIYIYIYIHVQLRIIHKICIDTYYTYNKHNVVLQTSFISIVEGSLEVKLPTIWTDEKQRWKGSERRERLEERRVEEKESEERRCRCANR